MPISVSSCVMAIGRSSITEQCAVEPRGSPLRYCSPRLPHLATLRGRRRDRGRTRWHALMARVPVDVWRQRPRLRRHGHWGAERYRWTIQSGRFQSRFSNPEFFVTLFFVQCQAMYSDVQRKCSEQVWQATHEKQVVPDVDIAGIGMRWHVVMLSCGPVK